MMRTLGIASAVVGAGLVALILHVGHPDEAWWWARALPFGLWIVGPALVPWLLGRRYRRTRWFPGLMLAFLLVSSGLSALAYYDAFFVSQSSTAALVLIFVPLYQWLVLLVLAAIAAIVARRQRG